VEQSEKQSIINYLKYCITDAMILASTQDKQAFDAIYDQIIHSELAKKLHIRDLKELHLIYLMLVNSFSRSGCITIH
jgi:hypothetical protein